MAGISEIIYLLFAFENLATTDVGNCLDRAIPQMAKASEIINRINFDNNAVIFLRLRHMYRPSLLSLFFSPSSSFPLSPFMIADDEPVADAPAEQVAAPSPAPAAAPTAPGLDDTSMCSANNEEDGRTSPCLESWAAQMSGASPAPLTPIPPPLVLPGL